MGQVKGPRPKTDLQAVRGRTGTELMDRMGIRTEAERSEILVREAARRGLRPGRALAQTE